mgnify:FL=1
MFKKQDSDVLSEKISEFRSLIISYAKQEVRDPLAALFKWTALGLIGTVFVVIGILMVAIGILRLLQDKVSAFENELSFVPYCITAIVLIAAAVFFLRSARKHN